MINGTSSNRFHQFPVLLLGPLPVVDGDHRPFRLHRTGKDSRTEKKKKLEVKKSDVANGGAKEWYGVKLTWRRPSPNGCRIPGAFL